MTKRFATIGLEKDGFKESPKHYAFFKPGAIEPDIKDEQEKGKSYPEDLELDSLTQTYLL